jgi:mannose-1-phosphate guanylyltransferase
VIPKPLFPFLNTPVLAYAMDHLARAGARQIACNAHHLASAVTGFVSDFARQIGVDPVIVTETSIRGTAGGVRGIWDALGQPDGTLVVLNGDSVMDIELTTHLQKHWESGAAASLLVRPRHSAHPGGVWVDEGGAVCSLRHYRSPRTQGGLAADGHRDFLGVHLIETSLLERISCAEGDIIDELYGPMLLRGETILASEHSKFWAALDNAGLVLAAQADVLANPTIFPQAPMPDPIGPGLHVYAPDRIAASSRVSAPLFLGAHVDLGEATTLGPRVVADRVRFAPGTIVRNALIFDMGSVEGVWEDCVAVSGRVKQLTV